MTRPGHCVLARPLPCSTYPRLSTAVGGDGVGRRGLHPSPAGRRGGARGQVPSCDVLMKHRMLDMRPANNMNTTFQAVDVPLLIGLPGKGFLLCIPAALGHATPRHATPLAASASSGEVCLTFDLGRVAVRRSSRC